MVSNLKKMGKDFTILYVEDEDDIRDETESFLKLVFKTVYVAKNGNDGVQAFYKHSPDLILTDLKMPKMNGIEMSKTIKDNNSEIPIIILSAFHDNSLLFDAIDIGIDKYLTKPLKQDLLSKTFLSILNNLSLKKDKLDLEIQLIKKHNSLLKVLDIANIGYWEWNIKDDVARYSQSALSMFELDNEKSTIDFSINQILKHINKEEKKTVKKAIKDTLENGSPLDITIKFTSNSSKIKFFQITSIEQSKTEISLMVHDNTKDWVEKEKLANMASKDILTGLLNKSMYQVFLNKQFIISKRYKNSFSIIKFTINNFDNLNTKLGNKKADKLIIEIVNTISTNIRESDTFARIFGVEFAIILPKSDLNESKILVKKLKDILSKTKFINYDENINISFAIASYAENLELLELSNNLDSLFKKAKEKQNSVIF